MHIHGKISPLSGCRPTSVHMNKAKAAALLIAFLGLVLVVPACNTTEGVGKDIKSAGESLEDAAQKAN